MHSALHYAALGIASPCDAFNIFSMKIAVSPMFLSWVIGFGSKAKVLHPAWVAEECRKLCMESMNQYRDLPPVPQG